MTISKNDSFFNINRTMNQGVVVVVDPSVHLEGCSEEDNVSLLEDQKRNLQIKLYENDNLNI